MRPRTTLLLAAGGGLVVGLGAFERAWPLMGLGLVPFAMGLGRAASPPAGGWRRVFEGGLRGLLFGMVAQALVEWFVLGAVVRFTSIPWAAGALVLLLHAAIQSVPSVLAAIVTLRLARLGVPRWAAFAIGVFAGTLVPTVFPWTIAGGLTPWPALVQLGDLIGERGVTALVAAAAGLVAEGIERILSKADAKRGAVLAACGVGLVGLLAIHGTLRIARIDAELREAPKARIALVQPDIEAHERWELSMTPVTLAKLSALTRGVENRGAELTVWPEAAYPFPFPANTTTDQPGSFAILQEGVRGPVLTGLITNDASGNKHNSAVVCENGKVSAPYHKMHLVWFGEVVPFGDVSPWMRKTFALGLGLSPGEHQVLLPALGGRVRAAVLNCFEDSLPGAGRETFAGQNPNLIVNITNDAWFYGSRESELHARIAVMRAVELRRDLVRAVNRGHTTWIDAAGRVRARYDLPMAGAIVAEPALLQTPPTAYARFGDWPFALLCLVVSASLVVRDRRRRA